MLWHYLKIAIRNLTSHPVYALVNLLGLTIGSTASLIIVLYAYQVLTYDHVHEGKDTIYLAYKERITPNGTQETFDTWVPLGERLTTTFPEVQQYARYYSTRARVRQERNYQDQSVIYSDPSLFDLFTFDFVYGESMKDQDLTAVAISRSTSERFFGQTNPVGREVEVLLEEDTLMRFAISGVFEDQPVNSSIRPEFVIQLRALPDYSAVVNEWGSSFLETWLRITPGTLPAIEAKFPDLIASIWGPEQKENTRFKLLPLEDYYDTLIGDKSDAYTLLYIAIGLLLIAGINFMNLATARSAYRTKEIGLRKVMGAISRQLRMQFLIESVVLAALTMAASILIIYVSLPYINEFFDLQLSLQFLQSPTGWGIVAGICMVLGIMSGLYPAFYLSAFQAIEVMRRKTMGMGSISVRNVLIVIQFTVAVLLISSALLIRNQLVYMSTSDMGFKEDQLLFIEASATDFIDRDRGTERINSFKSRIQSYAFVKGISASRNVPTRWTGSHVFVRPEGWTGDPLRMRYTYLDAAFFPTYGINVETGRNFLDDSEGDQRTSVILNRAAYKAFGFDTTQNPHIQIGSHTINVVGVVNDFNYESLRTEIAPTLHFHRTHDHSVHQFITVRLDGQARQALEILQKEWNSLGSTQPFTYRFIDDAVNEMYSSEQRFLGLVSFFTFVAVVIACLGLYGLTVFVVEKRRKEISIRKVVGAGIREIVLLIYRDFAAWMILALFFGCLFSYLLFQDWIEGFHYRAPIHPGYFLVTAVGTILLVILTVSFHAIRAALSNPIVFLHED